MHALALCCEVPRVCQRTPLNGPSALPLRTTHSHAHHWHNRSANANDAPKWTCGLHLLREPCVVFAWGSKDALDFEARVREWAPCAVHVFDPSAPSGSLPPSQVGASL